MPALTIRYNEADNDIIIDVKSGESLYSAIASTHVELSAPCGGRCFCGKCKVLVIGDEGAVNGPLPAELDMLARAELDAGYRLACAVKIYGDITVLPGGASAAQILSDGNAQADDSSRPSVEILTARMSPPDLSDQRGDAERTCASISSQTGLPLEFTHKALCELPDALRAGEFGANLVALVAMHEGAKHTVLAAKHIKPPIYGLAVDIGTTTVVTYLMDLETGAQIDVCSALNPQRVHGADVVSRTDYTLQNEDGLSKMQKLICGEIKRMTAQMAARQNIDLSDIYHMVCVGNTIMMHLFAGIPPKNIAVSPFIPVYTDALTIPAEALGLGLPRAMVTLAPCVSGYVGADTIAAVMASGMDSQPDISLLIDIGTNGEIALGGSGRIIACSTAAGPAFEGAHIRCGTGGVTGAVNRVFINNNEISYTTIGGVHPIGICGSGLVDAVALMKSINAIDEMGRITPLPPYQFIEVDGKPAFLIGKEADTPQIAICQRDLREVQLAKGAIAAGIAVLMNEMGVTHEDIKNVYLAGGFGNYIDYTSACNIGLLPMPLRDKISGIGNGAGAGAKKLLLSGDSLKAASALRKRMEYLELSSRADFQELFVEHMLFE